MLFSYNFNKKIKRGGLAPRFKILASRAVSSLLIALIAAIGTTLIVRAAPTILATMTAAFIGGDGDGKADPGETIEYTAVIQNNGTDATGVTFNNIIDLNTTLVNGSLNVSPLAIDDTYDTIGNTLLEVGVTASGNPAVRVTTPAIDSLFDNDTEFLGDTFTLKSVEADTTSPFTTATESGGSVTVEGNGNFSYTPPIGFNGADHFDYVLTDDGPDNILGNADDLTGAGRVTINVNTQRVWYVKNNATAGGLGRSSDPFDTLVEAQTASAANDTIYVFTGSGTTGQNAGISLKSGQRLLGEGVALTVPVSVNGGSNPTTLRAAGTKPTIGNAAGDGVSVSTVTLGAGFSNVEIRGLNISGTGAGSNAVDVTTNSTFGGSFELADNVISAAGAEGIDVNGGGSAALTVNLHDNTVTATGNGIDIFRSVGAGSVNIIAFDDNVVTGTTVGAIGINIVGGGVGTVLFDTDPGTASYVGNTVSGGNTVIGSSGAGNGVATNGMVLSNVKGDLSFTDLDIYTDNGAALSITSTTSNFLASGTGSRVTASTGTPTLVAVNGPALSTTQTNINIVPTTFSSTNSTTTGVSLVETSGTFTAPSGSSITNATGIDFFVDSNLSATATVSATYAGTITDNTGRLVHVQDVTGGSPTYIFSGAVSGSGATSTGVLLDNNDSATIRFSGGLALSTSVNPAFTATNGATAIEVCDEGPSCNPAATGALVNTLTSTTGTALNVASTTIGSNYLEFRSISANGATKGIILNTTGSSGGLKVNGTSTTDGSGGTIQNTTTRGAEFISTTNITLKNMNFTNAATIDNPGAPTGLSLGVNTADNAAIHLQGVTTVLLDNLDINGSAEHGINGHNVSGFTLSNSTLANLGNAADEDGLHFYNMVGTSAITNTTITSSGDDNINIQNNNNLGGDLPQTTTSNITISGGSANTGVLGSGYLMGIRGTMNTTVLITGVTANNNLSGGIVIDTYDTATSDIEITSVSSTNNNDGISLSGNNGNTKFDIHDNVSFAGTDFGRINILKAAFSTGGTLEGRIHNNPIVVTNGQTTDGITVQNLGAGTLMALITNNTFDYQGTQRALYIAAGQDGNATMEATVTGNTFDIKLDGTGNAVNAILAQAAVASPSGDPSSLCIDIGGGSNTFTHSLGGTLAGGDIRVRQRFISNVRLPGYVGGSTDTVAAAAYLDSRNAEVSPSTVSIATSISGGAACAQPSLAMLPNNNLVLSQNQPETNPVALAPVTSTNLNSANTFTFAFTSLKLPEQASEMDPANTVANASTTIGAGKPLFRGVRLAPALSGGPVGPIAIGNLPAGKSVTIKFQVTVDNPIDNPVGATQISNQGTVGYDVAQTKLTDDPSIGGISDPTITLIDRPDTTVSSINRHTPSTTPTNATSVIWRVTFANPVAGLTSSNFTLANTGLTAPSITTVSAVTTSPDTQWDVTVNTGTGDGTLGLNMTSDAGLSHDVTNLTFTGQVYTLDLTPPTVTMSSPAPSPTNTSPITVTAQFSENVNNFIATDIVAGNATVGNFIAVDGDTYTFDLIPSGQGLVTANIAASVAQDAAGNNNTAATQFSRTFDSIAPGVTLSSAASNPTNANPIPVTAQFTENVSGFLATDIVAVNATVGNFIAVDGDTYTFNLTPSGQGLVIADIAAGVATDAANNGNTAATQFSRTFDSAGPTVTMSSAASDPTNTSPIPVTVQFSENVTGFIASDITAGNATVGNFIAVDGDTYTFDLTPIGQGLVTADIAAGVAQDSGGNGNTASAQFSRTFDSNAPTVAMTSAAPDPTNTSPIPVTIQFSENVTGFVAGDITAGNATVGNFIAADGDTYTFELTPSAPGLVTADIAAGAAQDASGNSNTAAAQFSRTFDSDAPTVTINQAAGQADLTNASQINFTAVFSEAVTDFDDLGDVSLSGTASGTLGSIMGGPITYTVVVNVTTEGTVIASIPAGAAADAVTNLSTASTSTDNTVTYDTTPPSVTINQAAGQTDPTGTSPINFTVVFSEAVTNFDDAADVTLGGTAGATTSTITGGPTIYNVAVSGMTSGGTVTASIPAVSALDGAGNSNTTVSTSTDNTVTFIADAISPSVSSVNRANPSPSSAASVNFTVIFSETVMGVDLTDFTLTTTGVSGATVSGVSGSGTTYTVTVGTGSGTIRLDVLDNDTIIDAASNPMAGGFTSGQVYAIDKSLPSAAVQVHIAGSNVGNFSVAPDNSMRQSFVGLNNGPVKVISTNSIPIVASARVAYFDGSAWTSFSEMMGLPANQLTTSYTFPWYNNLDLNSQLRFGNVGTANTSVTVTIGGVVQGSYTLAPNASQRVSYAGLDKGPVKITSSGNVPIIASMRVAYFDGSAWTSFSELMGLPSNKLTSSYVFPWYNNVDLNSQLRFGNVGTVPTTVTVTVGGVVQGNYTLAPNTSQRVSYPGLDKGPVKVTSSGNVPIIASMRVAYFNGSAWTDFSEMMGLPSSSLSSHYSFPHYNNVDLNSQLRFGNVGNVSTTVTVTINGVVKGTYNLAPNQSQRISYAGLDSGPVVIQSSGGVTIIASMRVAYFDGSVWTSFAEMMGLPQSQLTTTYVFPLYNNVDINTQLRFGVP